MLARRACSLISGKRPVLVHDIPAFSVSRCIPARSIVIPCRSLPSARPATSALIACSLIQESRRGFAFSIAQEEADPTLKFKINARLRIKTGKYAAAALLRLPEPRITGVIQGAKLPTLVIDMDQKEVQRRYNEGSFKNRIFDMIIEGMDEPIKVFAQEIGYEPLTLDVRNVCFMRYLPEREYVVPIPVKVSNTQDNAALKKGALLIPIQREVKVYFKAFKGENMPPHFVYDARHSPVNTVIRSSHLVYPHTCRPIAKHADVPLFSITGRGRGASDEPEPAAAAPAAAKDAKAAPAAEKKDDKKK